MSPYGILKISDRDVLKVKLGHRRASLPLSCPPPAAYIVPSIVVT